MGEEYKTTKNRLRVGAKIITYIERYYYECNEEKKKNPTKYISVGIVFLYFRYIHNNVILTILILTLRPRSFFCKRLI